MKNILVTNVMKIPVADLLLSEINLKIAVFDSDLNTEGLKVYWLPFAEKYQIKLLFKQHTNCFEMIAWMIVHSIDVHAPIHLIVLWMYW